MSSIFRLAGRRLGNIFHKKENVDLLRFARPASVKVKPIDPDESHDQRNMRLKRPQSPHLSIYSPQLTALLSITQRATGIALTSYAIGFAMAALLLPDSIPEYIEQLECAHIGEIGMIALKLVLVSPISYHFWNGIRHLLWDCGLFLSIKQVYATGYIMLILAAGTAITLSIM